ncbi:SHOCT domain-containing protein [Amycolatopsis acididurans]|nr:SHOCT domain-containing protein [Amycolatopsis acididurans]
MTQLKELGELRRQGVLTEEEFQAEKQKILAT